MSIGFPHSQVELDVSPRREREVGADENPSLQFLDEFDRGVRYSLSSISLSINSLTAYSYL